MKKNFIAAGLLLAFVSVSVAGIAQTQTPVIKERQENQQKRIAGGVKSGELTAKETVKLVTDKTVFTATIEQKVARVTGLVDKFTAG